MRFVSRFKLYLGIFIPLCVFFLMSHNVSAVGTWVNNPNFNYWTLTYNAGIPGNGITRYDNNATPPFNILSRPSDYTNYLVGMTVNGIDVSGYTYDSYTTFYLDFQLRVVGGNGNFNYFTNVPPHTSFVVDTYSNPCDIDSSSSQLYYQYHCAVSLPENYSPRALYLDIGEPYASAPPFAAVAGINKSDAPSTVIKLNYLGYGFDTAPNQTNQYLDILSQQNQTIINQNQTIINNQNQNTDDIINNQSENTDDIINNQNENTEAIIKSNQNCHQSVNLMPLESVDFNEERTYYFNINLPAGTYTISYDLDSYSLGNNNSFSIAFDLRGSDNTSVASFYMPVNSSTSLGRKSRTFTLTVPASNSFSSNIRLQISEYGNGARAKLSNIQIQEGSTATSYEPFAEEICKNYNAEFYDQQRDATDNISNQSSSDIEGAENQVTTNLIGIITSFVTELSSFSPTDCNLNLPFPSFFGGNTSVNICQGKDVLGNFITLFSTLTAVLFYIPLAWVLLKMIYNEIRSWTNG